MTNHSNLVLDTISNRHCKRAFLDKKVPKTIIIDILDAAKNAPSSKNSQPWQIEIVTDKSLEQLKHSLCKAFDQNKEQTPDYTYMTGPMPKDFKERARECGYALYDLKNIKREDQAARRAHFRENYLFFDAPMAIIFHLHANAERGNFLDMGCFLQNILLGLETMGLGACPQFSVAGYPDTIKAQLGIEKERLIVCGLSLGYPDKKAIINTFIPKRNSTNKLFNWHH
tara:strand:- start:3922 stop:4602 length:681 start_codon:yes stop_codon:yes gene_type:complete